MGLSITKDGTVKLEVKGEGDWRVDAGSGGMKLAAMVKCDHDY